jgi:hypothetical protein
MKRLSSRQSRILLILAAMLLIVIQIYNWPSIESRFEVIATTNLMNCCFFLFVAAVCLSSQIPFRNHLLVLGIFYLFRSIWHGAPDSWFLILGNGKYSPDGRSGVAAAMELTLGLVLMGEWIFRDSIDKKAGYLNKKSVWIFRIVGAWQILNATVSSLIFFERPDTLMLLENILPMIGLNIYLACHLLSTRSSLKASLWQFGLFVVIFTLCSNYLLLVPGQASTATEVVKWTWEQQGGYIQATALLLVERLFRNYWIRKDLGTAA